MDKNYECHINVVVDRRDIIEALESIASTRGWKVSSIVNRDDLGDEGLIFLTRHDTDYSKLYFDMHETVAKVRALGPGFRVSRLKIEDIVYDLRLPPDLPVNVV